MLRARVDSAKLSERLLAGLGGQLRHPRGGLGWLLGNVMAWEHRALAGWACDLLGPRAGDSALDVGCGAGMTIRALASQGVSVRGVDHSGTMVRLARRRNRASVRAGRVSVVCASAEALPFPEGCFDVAISVESFQFWVNPEEGLREVHRVLRPSGRFAVSLEGAVDERSDAAARLGARAYELSEIADRTSACGFEGVRTAERRLRRARWLCAVGTKPAA